MTDASGKVYEHLEYFPFGETWVEENSNTQRTPYLFTAKELDEETGLYYFGARYYDPRTSVWQSADPILGKYLAGAAGGMYESSNLGLNSYGRNNPVIFKDPDGNIVPLIMGAIWLGGAAMTAYDTYQTYKHEGAKAAAVELAKGAVITAATGGAVKLAVKGFKIANDIYHVAKTTGYLQQHVNEVAKAVDETVAAGKGAKAYSSKQLAAQAKRSSLEAAHRGSVVNKTVRQRVEADKYLQSRGIAGKSNKGVDFTVNNGNKCDMTTKRQARTHKENYGQIHVS